MDDGCVGPKKSRFGLNSADQSNGRGSWTRRGLDAQLLEDLDLKELPGDVPLVITGP